MWGTLRNVRLERSCEIGTNRADRSWVILERRSLVVDFEAMSTEGSWVIWPQKLSAQGASRLR